MYVIVFKTTNARYFHSFMDAKNVDHTEGEVEIEQTSLEVKKGREKREKGWTMGTEMQLDGGKQFYHIAEYSNRSLQLTYTFQSKWKSLKFLNKQKLF